MKTRSTVFGRLLLLSILALQIPLSAFASGTAAMAFVLPEAKAGEAYEFTIKTEGGQPPFRWSVIEGNLPAGIELLPSGTLRGTPTIPRSQGYEFTLQVSDSSVPTQTYAQKFALVIAPGALRMVLNSSNKLTIAPVTQTASHSAPGSHGSTTDSSRPPSGSAGIGLDTALISGVLKGGNDVVKGFITPRAEKVFIEVFSGSASGRDSLINRAQVKTVDINTGQFNEKLSPALKKDQRVRVVGLLNEGGRQTQLISDEVTVAAPDPVVKAEPPTIRRPLLEGAQSISGIALPDSEGGKPTKVVIRVFNGGDHGPTIVADTTDIKKTGEYTVTFDQTLAVGQTVRAQAWVDDTAGEETPAENNPYEVEAIGDWGRARATFAFGAVFSKERDDFSKSDPYLDFNLDYNWFRKNTDRHHFSMLFNTFFATRLTTIPVDPDKQQQGLNSAGIVAKAADTATETDSAKCDPLTKDGFLCSRKSVMIQVGAYLPVWNKALTWKHGGNGNAVFVAPIAKAGMNTLTDDGEKGRNLLTFYSGGFRFGHFDTGKELAHSLRREANEAPRLVSYLDVTFGKWQNIEYLGERRLRTEFEGRIKIPALPLRLGFDANVGKGPDDLRFLIDTGFDVGKMFKKFLNN